MKIGIMGLGTIATKAYLPITSTTNSEITWVYHTRNREKLETLKAKFNLKHTTDDFDTFIDCGLDAVFIHTPTATHASLIELFLNRGIHVYVDKPVSENIAEVKALHKLAAKQNLVLMTGFNRRYAPFYQTLKAVPNKSMLIIQKHREAVQQENQFALFDLMIHIVDTAVYLLDEPIIKAIPHVVSNNNYMQHATLQLETATSTAYVVMNMHTGARIETVELMAKDGFYKVENMEKLVVTKGTTLQTEQFGDWTPTLEKRGFAQIIQAFIDAIQQGTSFNSIQSHELIDAINKSIQ